MLVKKQKRMIWWKTKTNNNHPGPFPGMLDVFLKTEEGRKAVGGSTVIGRVGRPEDIGASCIYLSSRAGSYVNGAVLPVDGGGLVGRYANM